MIVIRPVSLWSLLNFCLILLSSKLIHKEYGNNPSESRQSTYLFTLFNDSTTNSEIRSLNSLNDTIPDLLHIDWLNTLLVRTRWLETGRITSVVFYISLLQLNQQITGLLVITSYQKHDMFTMWLSYMFKMNLSVRIHMIKIEIVTILLWKQFITSNIYKLHWSFFALFLFSVSFFYPQIRFTNNVIKTLLDLGKPPICAHN